MAPRPAPLPVPRAPGHLPLIGHAWSLLTDPYTFFCSLPQTSDLVRVDLGTLPVYVTTSARLTYDVLVRKAPSFEKGRLFDRVGALVGNGLATAGGETHHRHRRLIQPMFNNTRIALYSTVMSRRALALASSWQPKTTLPINEVMSDLAIHTLIETLFGTDIDDRSVDAVRHDVPTILQAMLIRTVIPPVFDRLPIPATRRFDRATARLRRCIDDLIIHARSTTSRPAADLLATLTEARDADTDEALTDEEVRDELVTILFAGTETTATVLAWALYNVATHPQVEHRLLAEINTAVGLEPVTLDDIPKLPYLRRVVKETVRLYGVLLLMRRVIKPVELAGISLPPGTEVAFSLYALNRHPSVFTEPDRFDPDRWLPERAARPAHESFLPFGAGNRKCIGDTYARAELIIALATILARWRLRPIGPAPRAARAAMPYPHSLPMYLVPRTAA